MSAYIVDKNHIVYLVAAAMSRRINSRGGNFRWYWGTREAQQSRELSCVDYERAAEVGNMLMLENIKSVSYRYPNESSGTLPGPVSGNSVVTAADCGVCYEFTPAQVHKACCCLDYQSCEHPEWRESEACAFLDRLKEAAAHAMPGWEEAEWGAPTPNPGMICLSSLISRKRRTA